MSFTPGPGLGTRGGVVKEVTGNIMAQVVDYHQAPEDHRSLLVLVRHTGPNLHGQCFNRVYERISRVMSIHVQGQKRDITVRYRKSYSPEANGWGDFQGHRRVLGLITVGKCSDNEQFSELYACHKRSKAEYSSTVINSSLIAFGMNADGSPLLSDSTSEKGQDNRVDGNDDSGTEDGVAESDDKLEKELQGTSTNKCLESASLPPTAPPTSSSSSPSPLSSPSPSPASSNSSLPASPEKVSGSDKENSGVHGSPSRPQRQLNNNNNTKRRSSTANGVVLKVVPDSVPMSESASLSCASSNYPGPLRNSKTISRQGSATGSEVVFYPSLDSCDDMEDRIRDFVTSLYFVLEGKRLDRSFERTERSLPLCAPFEKKDFVGVDVETKSFKKKCMGRLRKHLGDLCLQAGMPGDAVLHYNTALDTLKTVNDFLWMAGCLEGLCCAAIILSTPKTTSSSGLKRNLSFQAVRGAALPETKLRAGSNYTNGLDILSDPVNQPVLNINDVVEKYKEAISYYAKSKAAAMIELEASLKACRFLIMHRKYLQASDFLQNAVYINFPPQEDDKIQRNITLASLYSQIGFKRKSTFFKRVAGMHCVAPDAPAQSWPQLYDLLLQCLPGFKLSLDPKEVPRDRPSGWPALQLRVLNELIYSARRMASNPQIAVRHQSLLVDLMLRHLTITEQREALTGLASLTARCQGSTQPLVLGTGLVLPPVPLLSLPIVRGFKLLPLKPEFQPTKLSSIDGDLSSAGGAGSPSNVFLYTPSSMNTRRADDSKPDFQWVCGDVCEASLQVLNPLADEINMQFLGLMTSDVEAESYPTNPSIPNDGALATVKLKLKPKNAGTLKILGYTSIVCGVRSNCRLKDLGELRPSLLEDISIQVVPTLPTVNVACSLPKAQTFTSVSSSSRNVNDVVLSGSAVLFAGQSTECIITVENVSEHQVERLSVKLNSKGDQDPGNKVLSWSKENIETQLPLAPGGQLCFSLCITGQSDFLKPVASGTPAGTPVLSRLRSDGEDGGKDKTLEAILCLQYSGAEGMQSGYCRQCSLAVHVDTLPSVYITKWNVLYTDSPVHCQLALEVVNQSGHQMDIHWGQDKSSCLAPLQAKRLSIEVHRLEESEIDLSSLERNDRIPLHYRSTKVSPDPYSTALARQVDIGWSIPSAKEPSAKAHGKVGVEYLTWTKEQLTVLVATKVFWDVYLNDQHFLPSSRLNFQVGEVIQVKVRLENASGESQSDCVLHVEPCLISNADDTSTTITDDFAVIGSSVLNVEEIQSGATLQHCFYFIFFKTGLFRLLISCWPGQKQHEQKSQDNNDADINQQSKSRPEIRKHSDWICNVPVRFEIT